MTTTHAADHTACVAEATHLQAEINARRPADSEILDLTAQVDLLTTDRAQWQRTALLAQQDIERLKDAITARAQQNALDVAEAARHNQELTHALTQTERERDQYHDVWVQSQASLNTALQERDEARAQAATLEADIKARRLAEADRLSRKH